MLNKVFMDPIFSTPPNIYGASFQQVEEKTTSQAEPISNQQQIESVSNQQTNVAVEEKTQTIAFDRIIHEEDLLDPINHTFMRKPVVLPCCGVSVDESSIEAWFAKTRKRNCYSCQKDCGKGPFAINRFLKNAIEEYKKVANIEDEKVETKTYRSDNQLSSNKTTLSLEEVQAQMDDIRSISQSGVEGIALAIDMLEKLEEQYPEEKAFSKLKKELQQPAPQKILSDYEALKQLGDLKTIAQQGEEGVKLAREMLNHLKQEYPHNKLISLFKEEQLIRQPSFVSYTPSGLQMQFPGNSRPFNPSPMPNMPNMTMRQIKQNDVPILGPSMNDKPLMPIARMQPMPNSKPVVGLGLRLSSNNQPPMPKDSLVQIQPVKHSTLVTQLASPRSISNHPSIQAMPTPSLPPR
jgi:hypothetical protein